MVDDTLGTSLVYEGPVLCAGDRLYTNFLRIYPWTDMAFDLEYVQDLIQEFDNQEPGFQAALDQRQSILKRLAFNTGILKFNTDRYLTDDQIKILQGFMNLIKESHAPNIPKPTPLNRELCFYPKTEQNSEP